MMDQSEQRVAAKTMYEAELAGLKEREARGEAVPALSYKRVGERYRNELNRLGAVERESERLGRQSARNYELMLERTRAEGAARRAARERRDERDRAASSTASATAAEQPTQSAPPVKSQSDIRGLLRSTPQSALSEVAEPGIDPAIYREFYRTWGPDAKPTRPLPPSPKPGEPTESDFVLNRLSPEVKQRIAALGREEEGFGARLRAMDPAARNAMIKTLADYPMGEQMAALSDLEAQAQGPVTAGAMEKAALGMDGRLEAAWASRPPEYRAEYEKLVEEYKRQGVDVATMGERGLAGFHADLNRRLARAYPDRYGTTISPGPEGPQSFGEHLAAGVQGLNERTPGLNLGSQLESLAYLGSAVGPGAPVGAGIAGIGAMNQAASSETMEDDTLMAGLGLMLPVIRKQRLVPPTAPEPPQGQLPPRTLVTPPPGPAAPNRQLERTLVTPPPGPAPVSRQLPPGSVTDDALSTVQAEAKAAPAPAPASKEGLAATARTTPEAAARDASASGKVDPGIAVRETAEQGLLPGFRRSTAPSDTKNLNVVREFQTAPDSPTFQVVTDPKTGRTGSFTVIDSPGEGGRPVVFLKVNGETVPFYRSQGGTSGKTAGEWYPFFGTDADGWLIKGNLKQLKGGFDVPEVQQAQKYLNSNFAAATPDEAVSKLRTFFNSPVTDYPSENLINRGAMRTGDDAAFSGVPRGRVNAWDAQRGGAGSPAAANVQRYLREQQAAMRGTPRVSTPDMAPPPKDVPGQMTFDRQFSRAERKQADLLQKNEDRLRSLVDGVLMGFNQGG
jgi:hypothetical protein